MLCKYCKKVLTKDEIALSKKLIGRDIKKCMCIECLADFLGCMVEDLEIKVEEFKEQGCIMFN